MAFIFQKHLCTRSLERRGSKHFNAGKIQLFIQIYASSYLVAHLHVLPDETDFYLT